MAPTAPWGRCRRGSAANAGHGTPVPGETIISAINKLRNSYGGEWAPAAAG